MFLKHVFLSTPNTRQHQPRRFLVKRNGLLQLSRANHRVDLRRVDPRMAEQRPHLLQVMPLLQHFHRHTVAEIMGLSTL